jgi:hypothetical protein
VNSISKLTALAALACVATLAAAQSVSLQGRELSFEITPTL